MLLKIVIMLLLFIVFYCLASSLYFLVQDEKAARIAKALTWRIGLSVVLFLLLILAYWMGWIAPHGLSQGGK